MKQVKILFALAGFFLVGAVISLMAFLFLPEKAEQADGKDGVAVEEPADKEQDQKEEDADVTVLKVPEMENEFQEEMLQREAEREVKRFRDEYGMEVDIETMKFHIAKRLEYEKMYGTTYALEEVILVEKPADSEGDEGTCFEGEEELDNNVYEENLIGEKIRRYWELYDINLARYEGMDQRTKLTALEIDYGILDDNGNPVDVSPEDKRLLSVKNRVYMEYYSVDESRYSGMTEREKFDALKAEYGSLTPEILALYIKTPEPTDVGDDTGIENESENEGYMSGTDGNVPDGEEETFFEE